MWGWGLNPDRDVLIPVKDFEMCPHHGYQGGVVVEFLSEIIGWVVLMRCSVDGT